MLAHLVTFSGLVVPLGNLFAPVVVGLVKRESAYVRYHARSALMFQLSFLLYEAISALLALASSAAFGMGRLNGLSFSRLCWCCWRCTRWRC